MKMAKQEEMVSTTSHLKLMAIQHATRAYREQQSAQKQLEKARQRENTNMCRYKGFPTSESMQADQKTARVYQKKFEKADRTMLEADLLFKAASMLAESADMM